MRILHIGDVVGKPGCQMLQASVKKLRDRETLDLVIANAENAADGSGITPKIYRRLIDAGVDAITLGDHIYRRREIMETLNTKSNIVKPANYPDQASGADWMVVEARDGTPVGIFSLLGRVFMKPVDCPWKAADRVLEQMPAEVKVRMLDFHAEATSDMQLMGRYLDGKVSAVLGTHTHVTTADEQIFPGGTAFQCDVGMTGAHKSILGRKIAPVTQTTLTFEPSFFQVATEQVELHGTIVDVDPATGQATSIKRLLVTQEESREM
ncbi:MAG TPA: metallophosphoesterase [Planctomycetaceae bacterium]|nr:metallophosphoesterase [Blastopirellula sp.]HAY81584.1 metallophosphoesterase [Planctomycetaceae bacterium]